MVRRQESARRDALKEIRRRFGWRMPLWMVFQWWYRRLCRYLSLREANRHHLMYVSSATRRLMLALGDSLAARNVVTSASDIFFLTAEEIRRLLAEEGRDWNALVAVRRAEHAHYPEEHAPDFIGPRLEQPRSIGDQAGEKCLKGIPISAGYVEGRVRVITTSDDFRKVARGDILVVPVIDPAMAPLLGLAGGLVIEMGGTLSHGAIIAREYGLPTVANVPLVTRVLKDGDLVAVDASHGEVRRVAV
jgi:pyruvate,water dikinase